MVRRKTLGAAMVAATVLAPAQTAFAHGGTGGDSSDYRIEITGFDGDPAGFEMRVVELGNRMEVKRTTAAEVQILGYENEPYLRLDAAGVSENINSPAHYLNLDRYSRTLPPPTATAKAEPKWTKLSDGTSVRWHDHRTHWMSPAPRHDVSDDPDTERIIFDANRVDLVVDGRPVVAIVRVTWLPKPSRSIWLLATSVLGCALLAALVLLPSTRRWAPALVAVAAAAIVVASGASTVRLVSGIVAAAVAVAGLAVKNRWLSIVGATIVGVLAATRFEVFEHQLLAGWAPAPLQRAAELVAQSSAAATVGSELVAVLGASAPEAVAA